MTIDVTSASFLGGLIFGLLAGTVGEMLLALAVAAILGSRKHRSL